MSRRSAHNLSNGTSADKGADWRHDSICRDEDPELFFAVGTSGASLMQIDQAKAVCRRCPVQTDCGEWAISRGVADGVWGGMSETEREQEMRRRGLRVNRVVHR